MQKKTITTSNFGTRIRTQLLAPLHTQTVLPTRDFLWKWSITCNACQAGLISCEEPMNQVLWDWGKTLWLVKRFNQHPFKHLTWAVDPLSLNICAALRFTAVLASCSVLGHGETISRWVKQGEEQTLDVPTKTMDFYGHMQQQTTKETNNIYKWIQETQTDAKVAHNCHHYHKVCASDLRTTMILW